MDNLLHLLLLVVVFLPNNVTGGNEKEYGLYSYDSAATMRLVPPLTKERISIHNGGGGNYGGEGKIVIVEHRTITCIISHKNISIIIRPHN